MDVAEDLYSKKIIEEDTFEDLQDTYEFSKNHDYERDKDNFDMEIQMHTQIVLTFNGIIFI